jgi:hypothetical protein
VQHAFEQFPRELIGPENYRDSPVENHFLDNPDAGLEKIVQNVAKAFACPKSIVFL